MNILRRSLVLVLLAATLSACVNGRLLSESPIVNVDVPLKPNRDLMVYVEARDIRSQEQIPEVSAKSFESLAPADQYLRDGIVAGMRHHSFRMSTERGVSNRHIDLELLRAYFVQNSRSVKVTLRVRSNFVNDSQRLSKTYEYNFSRDFLGTPSSEDIERMVSYSLDLVINSVVNDRETLEFLTTPTSKPAPDA